ncbi:MAG: YgiT-type zinc finger protein [Acidobacteria bacterium]|nr:YgiT-type zinc finger protein [Acidobacteriota bacterium]MBI3426113.1 YgiT-type zinc finger protein [Acidobacteriota bacterium]
MKQEQESAIVCSLCGQQKAHQVTRPQFVGKGKDLVIVENVPMISCRNCGHDYFSLEVARKLDRIRTKPREQTAQKSFAVAELV